LRIYASDETHTWIHKAVDMFGLGEESVSWIKTDADQKMDLSVLRDKIKKDSEEGFTPFMVVGTAGSVSTGVVDPLPELSKICKEFNLWFHVDGAYGAFAAALPDASHDLKGLSLADSVSMRHWKRDVLWFGIRQSSGIHSVITRPTINLMKLRENQQYHLLTTVLKTHGDSGH
jgi:threonine aldolase